MGCEYGKYPFCRQCMETGEGCTDKVKKRKEENDKMKFNYIVRDKSCHFIIYRSALLSESVHFIEKQPEPMMYEVVKLETGKVVY